MVHAWHDVPAGPDAPEEVCAIIEVPAGCKVKYELDKPSGLLRVDRVLYSSVIYPANYGFIPQSYGDDDDPLDILVLMQEPVAPLSLLRTRPVGVMYMRDMGQDDEKILAVHLDDPAFNSFHSIGELPEHRLLELRRFFQDYKILEGKEVEVDEFEGPKQARAVIARALRRYNDEVRPRVEEEREG